MDKRGQVYLLAAVIIAVVVFSLASVKNVVQQESLDNDFEQLSEVYNLESSRFLNLLLEEDVDDVSGAFFNFSYQFASYSRSQNPNYELFYAFKTSGGQLLVGNFLNTSITVYGTGNNILVDSVRGCFEELDARIKLAGISASVHVNTDECFAETSVSVDRIRVCINDVQSSPCYPLALSGKPQLLIVTGASEGNQRQVYVGGEGLVDDTVITGVDEESDEE